jgi:hypothetical protein
MAVAFDPKADYSKRTELLKICTDRGISHEKLSQIVEPMRYLSHEEREQMAAELIPLIESGIYDSEPRHLYHKTEWYENIHRLHNANDIRFETVRPIVEDILLYCKISTDTIKSIFLLLQTEEHLRQMYNWLMEQLYVPDESACLAKAEEFGAKN